MDFNLSEWLNLVVRWVHVFAGILWIGQTYFFTWLDGRLSAEEEAGAKANPGAQVWMVHSGGFYVVEKQKTPELLPGKLHWFRWEAALTWLSGMVLLTIVYYMGGALLDDSVADIRLGTGIAIGIGVLKEGRKPDAALAARAKLRSKHNTYMVVPVVFIMVSNHFPTATYGNKYNWIFLAVLVLLGWGAAKLNRNA